jgi:NAD(P)H-nitrite reductase large subunit
MRRVVVIGNGMAGARFVDELCKRDPAALVTVFGAEDRPAYNRILLSDVLAGKRRHDEIALTEAPGRVIQRLGTAVRSIDLTARTVLAADGTTTPYDALVLATGSTALVPPVQGIAGPDGCSEAFTSSVLSTTARRSPPQPARRRPPPSSEAGCSASRQPAACCSTDCRSRSCTAWGT